MTIEISVSMILYVIEDRSNMLYIAVKLYNFMSSTLMTVIILYIVLVNTLELPNKDLTNIMLQ